MPDEKPKYGNALKNYLATQEPEKLPIPFSIGTPFGDIKGDIPFFGLLDVLTKPRVTATSEAIETPIRLKDKALEQFEKGDAITGGINMMQSIAHTLLMPITVPFAIAEDLITATGEVIGQEKVAGEVTSGMSNVFGLGAYVFNRGNALVDQTLKEIGFPVEEVDNAIIGELKTRGVLSPTATGEDLKQAVRESGELAATLLYLKGAHKIGTKLRGEKVTASDLQRLKGEGVEKVELPFKSFKEVKEEKARLQKERTEAKRIARQTPEKIIEASKELLGGKPKIAKTKLERQLKQFVKKSKEGEITKGIVEAPKRPPIIDIKKEALELQKMKLDEIPKEQLPEGVIRTKNNKYQKDGKFISKENVLKLGEKDVLRKEKTTQEVKITPDKRGVSFELVEKGNRSDLRLEKQADGSLKVIASETQITGRGLGTRIYEAAIKYAKDKNVKLTSDNKLTESAYKTWQGLKKKVDIVERPTEKLGEGKDLTYTQVENKPIFELKQPKEVTGRERIEQLQIEAVGKEVKIPVPKGEQIQRTIVERKVYERARTDGLKKLKTGIDPTQISDLVKVGTYHLEGLVRGGIKKAAQFTEWSKQMVKDLGQKIKPHLLRIWGGIKKEFGKKIAQIVESPFFPIKQTKISQAKLLEAQQKFDIKRGKPTKGKEFFAKLAKKPSEKIYKEAIEQARKQKGVKGFVQKSIESLTREKKVAKDFARGLIEPITSTLFNIKPIFKQKLREYEFSVGTKSAKRLSEVDEYIKRQKKMTFEDQVVYDLARKNGDEKTVKALETKYNLTELANKKRKVLDKLADEMNIQKRDVEYNPRKVKDYEGFLNFFMEELGDAEVKNIFETLIRKREEKLPRRKKLTVEEKARLINNALRGYNPGIRLSRIGNLKDRVLPKVEARINKFYYDSNTSLIKYIEEATQFVESRRFFGRRDIGDINESIAMKVLELTGEEKLNYAEAIELERILKGRFNEIGTRGIISTFKNISYASLLGSPASAIRQIGDLAIPLYRAGLIRTVKEATKSLRGKSEVPLETFGISPSKIAQEFGDVRTRSKALSQIFRIVGFTKVDKIGKETLVNAVLDKYRKQAKNPTPEFNRRLKNTLGDEAPKTIEDLKSGKVTENVKLLLFNELSDSQPITLSEMPLTYLRSGNGRIFYMLKTFFIRRLDFYRNETFKLIKNPKTRKEGIRNLIKLTSAMIVMESGADVLINLLLGRENTLNDMVVDNILKIVGFSSWNVKEAKKEGIGTALWNAVSPPVNIIDDVGKDIMKLKPARSVKHIPVFGKIYYWWFKDNVKNRTRSRR